MAEYTDVFEIPSHGGRRAGAGGPKGYSKKRAAEMGGESSVDGDDVSVDPLARERGT